MPSLSQPPTVASRNATSITVHWTAWQNPPDTGDGPVEGYFLYYRPLWDLTWSTVRVAGLGTTVDELEASRAHQFRVLPIHRDGFVGFGSPPLNVSTCGGGSCPYIVLIKPTLL